MNQVDRNQSILYKYIPEKAVSTISEWIYQYDFKLKIKKSRSTKYGDYRPPLSNLNHQITINYDLNKYAFLVTLIHEVAHLTNWNKYKNRVKPHGEEWKQEYKLLMEPFLKSDIFPEEIMLVLKNYMQNPAASSCSAISLLRALKKHDNKTGIVLLEELPMQSVFKIAKDRHFIKGDRIRKCFKCLEIKTKREYLFKPLSEVTLVNSEELPVFQNS